MMNRRTILATTALAAAGFGIPAARAAAVGAAGARGLLGQRVVVGAGGERDGRAAEAQQAQGAAAGGEAKAEAGKKDDGNVVDAEYEEVKDKK